MAFIAFLVVIAAFAIYFFFFVEQRKEDLSQKNFRILAQVSENILQKVNLFDNNIKNVETKLHSNKKEVKGVTENSTDSLFSNLKSQGVINPDLELVHPEHEAETTGNLILREGFIIKKIKEEGEVLEVRQNLSTFLKPLLWREDFAEYLIVNSKDELVYQKGNKGIFELRLDSLFSGQEKHNPLKASITKDIQLEGSDYKLFGYPFRLGADQKYVLIGLIPASDFDDQSMHISPFTVIFAALLFFLLLLSFPFIKIFLISSTERFTRFDIMLCMISLFTITGLISLLIIDSFQYKSYSNKTIDESLESVSQEIRTHMENEMWQALLQLRHYDLVLSQNEAANTSLVEIDTIANLKPSIYKDFDMLFWINSQGTQTRKWTPQRNTTSLIDVSKRGYFNNIAGGTSWSWKQRGVDEFYLESIYSLNTGEPYAVLSLPSKNDGDRVVAMTTSLKSILDPTETFGFKFALIDESGHVLFHSDRRRNLQENLLEDIGNEKQIASSLISRTPHIFSTSYYGKDQKAHITPVESWPLYLVTFYDLSFFKAANAEILTFSTFMLFIYGLLILSIFVAIYLNSYSHGKLNYIKSRLNWLLPQPKEGKIYMRTFIYQLVSSLVLLLSAMVIYHLPGGNSQLILLVFINPLYLIIGSYFLMHKEIDPAHFKRRHLPIVLFAVAWLSLFGVLLVSWGLSIWPLLFYQLILLTIFIIFKVVIKRRWFAALPYPINYKLAVLSFLLAICLPAVVGFFKISHDTEFRLYTKYMQLDLAHSLQQRSDLRGKDSTVYQNNNSIHLSPLVEIAVADSIKETANDPDSLFTLLYEKVRPIYSENLSKTHQLDQENVEGGNWEWLEENEQLQLNFQGLPAISSDLTIYDPQLQQPLKLLWFLIVAAAFTFLIYFLISFIFRKTVITEEILSGRPLLLDMELFGKLLFEGKAGVRNFHNVFLIGLPNSGKTRFVHDKILNRNENVCLLDLIELRESSAADLLKKIPEGCKTVVLDHFEYGLHEAELIYKKLEVKEVLLQRGNLRMVVISTVYPLELTDKYTLAQSCGMEAQEAQKLSERWLRIIGTFYKSFYTIAFKKPQLRKELNDLTPFELIESECRFGSFLSELEEGLKRYVKANKISNDEIILRIQSLANFYYYSLWKNCSSEEKYLLYDLAQDGVVNSRNLNVIKTLINKGLVISYGTLKIMNRSFRNFILTTVNPEEALALEHEVNKGGTWKVIRVPLLLTLLALGLFIFYTQEKIYHNITAFIGSIAVALPMIFKVVSSFQSHRSGDNS